MRNMRILMTLAIAFASILSIATARAAVSDAPIRTVAEFNLPTSYKSGIWRPFELSGTIIADMGDAFLLEDETGRTRIPWPDPETKPKVGAKVRVTGQSTALVDRGYFARIQPKNYSLTAIGSGAVPEFTPTGLGELLQATNDFLFVKTEGTITEICPDDIDPRIVFLTICDGDAKVTADVLVTFLEDSGLEKLIGARIRAYGIFVQNLSGFRLYFGPHLTVGKPFGRIEIITPAPEDPFDAPDLSTVQSVDPRIISSSGPHSVRGTVLARTDEHSFILLNDLSRVQNISLGSDVRPPKVGMRVLVVGTPCTDLYHINLHQAVWRPEPGQAAQPQAPTGTTSASALFDTSLTLPNRSDYHGQLIRLRGVVRRLPPPDAPEARLFIESDGYAIPLCLPSDCRLPAEIRIGTTVDATGIWAFSIDNWRPDAILPRIKGGSLFLRGADDIAVVSQPPKWTSRQLLWALAAISLVVIALGVWTQVLKRTVVLKTRELKHEEVARLGETMRVDERTRLATELHDSLLQTLSGVTFQIDAADRARRLDPSQLEKYIMLAKQTLANCQTELRNCIWDLRNHALDGGDAEEAIRTALKPFVASATVNLDFDVPRAIISDSTFHTIICIVRELAVNAVRHGKATVLSIAGHYNGHALEIRVADNGCGFDPDERPGSDEGHFGIQGIQERLLLVGGSLVLDSKPGSGTTATVTIRGTNHEEN